MLRYPTLLLAVLTVGTARVALAQDPVKLSPAMYKVLLDNDQVRVLEFRAKPGQSEPMHSHPAMTVYDISGGRIRLTTPDGKTEIVNYRAYGNLLIVDRLFAAAELRLGGEKQQKVRIIRNDGSSM